MTNLQYNRVLRSGTVSHRADLTCRHPAFAAPANLIRPRS